jgi:hypothetical protein
MAQLDGRGGIRLVLLAAGSPLGWLERRNGCACRGFSLASPSAHSRGRCYDQVRPARVAQGPAGARSCFCSWERPRPSSRRRRTAVHIRNAIYFEPEFLRREGWRAPSALADIRASSSARGAAGARSPVIFFLSEPRTCAASLERDAFRACSRRARPTTNGIASAFLEGARPLRKPSARRDGPYPAISAS